MVYKKFLIIIFLILAFFFFRKKEEETVFSFWTVQLKAPVGDLIQKNIDEFQKKHPKIKIVWVDIPITEAQKRSIASILGGNPPDLINLNPEYSLILAQRNALLFFDEKDTKEYNDGLVDKLKFDGKIYGLPFYATSAVTILNKEKFKNCPYPKTYDDILTPCTPVFGNALNEGEAFSKILNKYDINSKNLENIEEIYNLFYKMNAQNKLLKDALTINHRESIEKYMSNSASFITAGSNFITMIKQNAPDIYKKSIIKEQLTGSNGQYDVSLMNFVIPKNAKNKELALEFAHQLLNEENQLEFAKKTNVLPANKKVLENKYFKNCKNELTEQARCIAAKQLNNPIKEDFGYKNKKEITEQINKELEILFLKGKKNFDPSKNLRRLLYSS